MSRKIFTRSSVLILFLLAALTIPLQVRAGGACGGAYTIDPGDTVEKLASMCGTSSAAIYAANPGLKEPLTAGQVITIPGSDFGVTPSPVAIVTIVPVITSTPVVDNTYNYYNHYNYYPVETYSGRYVVQPGDTFSGIAYRFGVTIHDLWKANPYIWDINLLYVGQVLYIPASYWTVTPPPTQVSNAPEFLSYDHVPNSAPHGGVTLSNQSNSDVYVSLQCTTGSGMTAINEYTVNGTFGVNIPAGWCDYVAWVGGVKHTGGFKLGGDSQHTMTFYKNRVQVD